MKGMILAAGFGTRFRPATFDIPKPMIPLCNRPLIEYPLEAMLAANTGEIIVNLHHLPEMLQSHLIARYSDRCQLEFSFEKEILGTGGALRRVRSILEKDESFFLANGDTVQFPSFSKLEDNRQRKGVLASMLLRRPPSNDKFTQVSFDGEFVKDIGDGEGESLMFAGAQSISTRIFDYLPDRDFSGIIADVYIPLLRGSRERIAGVLYDGPWFDIGTPLRYVEASDSLRELMMAGQVDLPSGSTMDKSSRSLFGLGVRCHGMCSDSVIGSGAHVAEGTVIDKSVLWDGAIVEADARLQRCVVAGDVVVPAGLAVSNALLCAHREDVEYGAEVLRQGDFVAVPIDPQKELVIR